VEHRLKSFQQRSWDATNISAVEATVYAERFLEFVNSVVV
jgi:hypothetical protein